MSTVVLNASPRKAGSKAQGVATNAPTPGSPHQTKTKRGAADTAASTPGSTPARVRLKTASTPSSTSKGGHASDIAHAWATGFNRSHLKPPNPHAPYELANIIKPHVESFNFAVEKGGALDQAVALLPAQTIEADPVTHRPSVRFWLAEIQIGLPRKSDDSTDVRLFPNECREGGRSYTAPLIATVNRSVGGGAPTQVTVSLGELPIMVRSKKCHLHGLTRDQLIARREEGTEMGGYFIINGNERLIRLLIVPRRNHVTALVRPSFGNRDAGFTEFACTIRCVRPDQSAQSLTLHYLSDGTSRLRFTFRKQEFFVPSYVLLRALVDSTDREVYERITDGNAVGNTFAADRAELMIREGKRLKLRTRKDFLRYLGDAFRHVMRSEDGTSSEDVAATLLRDHIFVHCCDQDQPTNDRNKFNLLIFMIQKLYALVSGEIKPDNPDALSSHEILLPGHLYAFFLKEKLHDWLGGARGVILKDLRLNPAKVQLTSDIYFKKALAADVGKKVHYLMVITAVIVYRICHRAIRSRRVRVLCMCIQ